MTVKDYDKTILKYKSDKGSGSEIKKNLSSSKYIKQKPINKASAFWHQDLGMFYFFYSNKQICIISSLRESSSIWACEANRAKTREQAVMPQEALIIYYLYFAQTKENTIRWIMTFLSRVYFSLNLPNGELASVQATYNILASHRGNGMSPPP